MSAPWKKNALPKFWEKKIVCCNQFQKKIVCVQLFLKKKVCCQPKTIGAPTISNGSRLINQVFVILRREQWHTPYQWKMQISKWNFIMQLIDGINWWKKNYRSPGIKETYGVFSKIVILKLSSIGLYGKIRPYRLEMVTISPKCKQTQFL